MSDSRTAPPPSPPAGRMRVRDLCEQEGISRRTAWRWVDKGLLHVSRRGPRTGVRVSYPEASGLDDDGSDDFG